MKKLISVILSLTMLLVAATAFADADAVLKVGTNPEFAPFEYIGDTGEVEGIDIDIINAIGAEIGMDIAIESMDFDALVPSLVTGKIDACIAGMTITDEKKLQVLFSEPYFKATQVVIVKEDSEIDSLEALKGKKVGVQLGTTGDLMISAPQYEIGEVVRYTKVQDAALDIMNGRLDAIVIDTLPAYEIVKSVVGLIVYDDILADAVVESYGIAVQLGQDELMDKINAALLKIEENGTFDEILSKYLDTGAADDEAAEGEVEAAKG